MLFKGTVHTLHTRLRLWQKCKFMNAHLYLHNCKRIIDFFDALEEARLLTPLEKFIRIKVKERAYELALNDELKWQHRSRCKWISAGDRNTAYFHAVASSRAGKKAITEIMYDGRQITAQAQIMQCFLEHYQGLMGTKEPTQPINVTALYPMPLQLSHLDAPFTESEVLTAVRNLPMNKASGPDGLPNEFARQHWEEIQPHVMRIFDDFFFHRTDLTHVNEGRIVLLPKHDAPARVSDYRPISVINLIPKIISKVLANRIKPHLQELVSKHQTAFVRGRYIAENFLTARELLHHVHHAASPAILLKLDFAKAYDTLDWVFLERVLTTRGFPPKFIAWILSLLNTATSKLEINGQFSRSFKHNRGLRQGDPLSPYLFIIAADVFQQMTVNVSLAAPHRLTNKIPHPIVNLQYADDTILFASARGPTLQILMLAILSFTAASGLKVNHEKSSFIPLALDQTQLRPIEEILQCKHGTLPITYLGMPLTLNAPSRQDYTPLLQSIEKRLQGWHARFISRAGKLQLIKSVLSIIPTYFMSCFKLPRWLLARLEAISRRFLWARKGQNHPIHLINWQVVCLPHKCAGMGVLNLRLQNSALLLRWIWKLFEPDRKLWGSYAVMIHAVRPNPEGPLILSPSGSFFWRILNKFRPLFHSCAGFEVGSGRTVSFWFDAWAGLPIADQLACTLPGRYISLYDAKQRSQTLFPRPLTRQHHQATLLLSQFSPRDGPDTIRWKLSASGRFSVNSVYSVLSQGGRVLSDTASIWKSKVTPSMRFFFFLLINNRILTHDVMQRRNLNYTPGCVMCDRTHAETAVHLFFSCSYSHSIWMALAAETGHNLLSVSDSVKSTYMASGRANGQQHTHWNTTFITALWSIWRERNQRTFRGKSSPSFVIVNKILQDAELYLTNC